MAINPFANLFGTTNTPSSPLSTIGSTAATAATGIPFNILLPIVGTLLSALFGKDEEEEKLRQEQERLAREQKVLEQMKPRVPIYESPFLSTLDPIIFQALLNNFKRMANWGYPAGTQMDLSFLENLPILSSPNLSTPTSLIRPANPETQLRKRTVIRY